ncbi:hypothetical protein A2U01_0088410, partial [Trifolium medium]|nr:hypothetical protein [Trifolium medium]
VPDSKEATTTQCAVPEGEPSKVNHVTYVSLSSRASALGERQRHRAKVHPSKRTMSCPPGATRSIISGPWSLEWLHDRNHGDAG